MEFMFNYGSSLIALLACIAVIVSAVIIFVNQPAELQLAKVKEWLLFAVAEAEKDLGSGTGQLKLRYVYNLFLTKFPYLVQVVSFEVFSDLVDEALEKFKAMVSTNTAVKQYVGVAPNKEV